MQNVVLGQTSDLKNDQVHVSGAIFRMVQRLPVPTLLGQHRAILHMQFAQVFQVLQLILGSGMTCDQDRDLLETHPDAVSTLFQHSKSKHFLLRESLLLVAERHVVVREKDYARVLPRGGGVELVENEGGLEQQGGGALVVLRVNQVQRVFV